MTGSVTIQKVKDLHITKTKIIYDYKNADFPGLIKYIKDYFFESTVFSQPIKDQTNIYTYILKKGFEKFVPLNTITIRPYDAPWCNSYTRLLLRKKNRNYKIYKKYETDYQKIITSNNPSPETVTRYLNRKNKAFEKSRQSANESCKANKKVKTAFSINSVLNNYAIPAKKKFAILLKLMKITMVENDNVVNQLFQITMTIFQIWIKYLVFD